jgi:hypothetical protein
MKFRYSLRAISIGLLIVGSSTFRDAPARGAAVPAFASPRVHPEATSLFAHRARTGRTLPGFRTNDLFERSGLLPVAIRWLTAPTAEKRTWLETRGVTFERNIPSASGVWLATTTAAGLHALEIDPEVARVSVDMVRAGPSPLDDSREETTASAAERATIARFGDRLDGRGIVIADIDSPVYLHHPSLFRADGGAFAWVDVNGDDRLTPGTDGVDLDGNGAITPDEVLRELPSEVTERTGEIEEPHGFEPAVDYLYLDTNGNGRRDRGRGFDEATPAYGEPLFVFDDANHDGVTQTSERVLRLKTSKVRAITTGSASYERGATGAAALVRYPAVEEMPLPRTMSHGTAVAGILAAGQPGISRRLGIAPEAELLIHDTTSSRGTISVVQWALDRKANVILTEFARYTGVSLDGSSEDERILDAAHDAGVLTVSPAGNLANGAKHRTLTLEPGPQELRLTNGVETRSAFFSLHYRGSERAIGLVVELPDGTKRNLPDSAPAGVDQDDGTVVYVTRQTTPRGTHEIFVQLWSPTVLPRGAYSVTATLDGGAPVEVDAYVSDEVRAWSGGLTFDEGTPTRTLCSPATSDTTIAVAAYSLESGATASSSSRGPRLDGAPGIDIAAPADPVAPAPPSDDDPATIRWSPFGGTSGAGAHVAGAVALLMQAFPNEDVSAYRSRLLAGARPFVGGESAVGKGKLDIARALDIAVLTGSPPNVVLEVVEPRSDGSTANLRVVVRDDEADVAITARWDLDYDGTFDTGWIPLGEQPVPLADGEPGTFAGVKVEVRDAQGNLNGATARIERPVLAGPVVPSGPPATDACTCDVVGAASDRRPDVAPVMIALAALMFCRRRVAPEASDYAG